MKHAKITIQRIQTTLHISSIGSWLHHTIEEVYQQLNHFDISSNISSVVWNFNNLKELDAAGVMVIIRFMRRFDSQRVTFIYTGLNHEYQRMFLFYRKNIAHVSSPKTKKESFFYSFGKWTVEMIQGFFAYISFIGKNVYQLYLTIRNPELFRFKSTLKHIEVSGICALPIVGLTAFLVGLVIAYQSAEQLKQFGATIFIVEMICFSVFRELAPLIAAIVVAGRSASAYTAEIGIMKITEEVDAMQTMGFEPHRFLVLPRIIALIIALPLIVFFADILGIFGGMLIAQIQLDFTFSEFIARMHNEVEIRHILIGLIKAPFFGLIIASIGCFRGFQVSGSTDSIGKHTTISVVNACFWVIAINAVISVFLTEMGI